MVPSGPSESPTAKEVDAMAPLDAPPAGGNGTVRIDFALLGGDRLLVYGWILGFGDLASGASIQFGKARIDLTQQSIRVRRPDVAEHFSRPPDDDLHGFYALVELPPDTETPDHLVFTSTSLSGETEQSLWPVVQYSQGSESAVSSFASTLKSLIRHLPQPEGRRLSNFVSPEHRAKLDFRPLETLPPPVQLDLDLCCMLENKILVVYGWIFDPVQELKSVSLGIGGLVFDLFQSSIAIPRQDINPNPLLYRLGKHSRPPGFLVVRSFPSGAPTSGDLRFMLFGGSGADMQFAKPITWNAHDSRQELFSLIQRLDVESALVLTESIVAALAGSPELAALDALMTLSHDRAVERLPASTNSTNPRYSLHIDQSIPVADKGIYFYGWFYADKGTSCQIVCHCGDSTYPVTGNWVRHPRADVTSYLATLGCAAGDNDHGFSCYVPVRCGERPYYLSVTTESGEVRRVRIPAPEGSPCTLQNTRALLQSFHNGYRELRTLLDRQIGPAVQAVWSARPKSAPTEFREKFGAEMADPPVTILVPLYGRCDFAEFQIALFADDPDFQSLQLIYVVDDPSIFEQFRATCPDLFGIYRVPFEVLFPGENLGFAGANNYGAARSRGKRLLFLNSDVMPKRHGWVSELLRIHDSLDAPGLLGAKLLYEDGTLQHGGIAFQRHAPWGGLWINDHPAKGLNPAALTGVREADAVTAACALIDAELYRSLDGFSEDYILGDFEDSDLCLAARKAGRRNYAALDVELYHLERQSQQLIGDALWRRNLTIYNCWLHNERWKDVLEQIGETPKLSAEGAGFQ